MKLVLMWIGGIILGLLAVQLILAVFSLIVSACVAGASAMWPRKAQAVAA